MVVENILGRKKIKDFVYFKGQLHELYCSPNLLILAPWFFTKILKTIFTAFYKEGYEIMSYLYDFILLGNTFEERKLT